MNVKDLKLLLDKFPDDLLVLIPYEWDYCCYKNVRKIYSSDFYINEFDEPEVIEKDKKKIEMLKDQGVVFKKGLIIK